MESSALCFRLSVWREDDPEYIAPELLPAQDHYTDELDFRHQARGSEAMYYRYTQPFLHLGLMRRFMVQIGRQFQQRALYWKDGLCIDVSDLATMAIITCERGIDGNPARNRIIMEVCGPQRQNLLNRLRNELERLVDKAQDIAQAVSLDGHDWVDVAKLPDARILGQVISEQRNKLDAQPFLFLLAKDAYDDLSAHVFSPPIQETAMAPRPPAVYISYAWGDAQEAGVSREDIVDQLYDALLADGYRVKRDKMDLGYKGLISAFMQEIGRGDCIVIVISDKYLKSPFCMYELWEIYRNQQFHERICPIVLADAKIKSLADRLAYMTHWKDTLGRIEQAIQKVGLQVLSAQGSLNEYEKYREITYHADKLLTYLADINSQTPQLIAANEFETLKRAIDQRLQQLQSPDTTRRSGSWDQ